MVIVVEITLVCLATKAGVISLTKYMAAFW